MQGRLIGVWKLESFREMRGGVLDDVFGPHPNGFITYTASGHMTALLSDPRRPRLSGAWSGVTDHSKALCYDGLVAYGGRFSESGDTVTHHVEICWIPNWEGRDLVRRISFENPEILILRTVDDETGRQAAQVVRWRKTEIPG